MKTFLVPLSQTGIPKEEKPDAGPENALSWLSGRSPPSWLVETLLTHAARDRRFC